MKKQSSAKILGMLCILSLPNVAHAYMDPGTGSLLAQYLAAAGLGVLFYIKQIFRFLKRVFTNDARPK